MNITIIRASGLIGTKLADLLRDAGHHLTAASRESGVDILTGEGLAEALTADALVDVTNSPSFADDDVMAFFTTSTSNLLGAAAAAGVGNYVALSIVGVDGVPDSGYMRAKVAQERLIAESGLPYTIVRATQFHEFAETITATLTDGATIRVPDALIQPISADEVAAELARVAAQPARGGVINIGGPEKITFAELANAIVKHRGDNRTVITDPGAQYFGGSLSQSSLVTGEDATVYQTRLSDWLTVRQAV